MVKDEANISIKIAPSILSSDFSKLGEEVEKLEKNSSDYIHLDVMDGHFVPNLTIGPSIVKSIRRFSKKPFDVHLMMTQPEKYIKSYSDAGADLIGVHHEIEGNVIERLKMIKGLGKKATIVFNPDSKLDQVSRYFPYVDQILIMSVFPGFGGQKFISESLERGRFVREEINKKADHCIDLEIDGGIGPENAEKVIAAGYNVLVSGSALYESKDMDETIKRMKSFPMT